MVSTFETSRRRCLVGKTCRSAVLFAIRPRGSWIAAETKIRTPWIAVRPAAGSCGKRKDLLGSSGVGVCDGGCFDAGPGGLCWHRFDERENRRFRAGMAVCPDGDRNGSLLDLVNCDHPGGQQTEHDADTMRDAAIAMLPTSNTSRTDAEELSNAALREAERVERRAEFDH